MTYPLGWVLCAHLSNPNPPIVGGLSKFLCVAMKYAWWLDSIAVSVFVVILVEFDKYSESETSRLV